MNQIGPLQGADDGSSSIVLFVAFFFLVLWWAWPIIVLSIPFWNTRAARRLGFWLKRHLD